MLKKVNGDFLLFVSFLLVIFYTSLSYGNIKDFHIKENIVDKLPGDHFYHNNLHIKSLNTDDFKPSFLAEDLTLNWKYFKTAHLKIIYPDYLYNFSLYISNIGEDVYRKLSKFSNFYPRNRIIILISPRGDSPNGYVTIGPRGLYITIYAVHPYEAIDYGLDSYKEWYKTLLSHEFAHVFHIGEIRGISNILSRIFGRIVYPNALTPVFYREGFAVNFETSYNNGIGRANSNYSKMYIRSAFAKNPKNGNIWIDRFSSKPDVWPFTTGCYLYGASFLEYLKARYGNSVLYRMNFDSCNFYYFPWIYSFKKETGLGVGNLWTEWLNNERLEQKVELNKIKRYKLTKFRKISPTSGYIYSISLSRTGRYAFYSMDNGEKVSGLYMYDFYLKKNRLIRSNLICKHTFIDENNRGIFYIREDYDKERGWLNNIYYLDLKRLTEFKLSQGGHISDFKFYDKDNLLLIKSTENGNRLYFGKLDRKLMKISVENEIINPYNDCRVESPDFAPDRSKIAFSVKESTGKRFIVLANIKNVGTTLNITKVELLSEIPGSNYFPKWINNRFISFINDNNGVFNLYIADLFNEKYYRVTNLITGILDYDISVDGDVIGKIYSPDGFFIGYWNLSDQNRKDFFSKKSFSIVRIKLPKKRIKIRVDKKLSINQKNYSSLKYLFPSYWLPITSGNGVNLGIGLFTINHDYIGRFDYSFALVYDIVDDTFKLSLSGNYNFPQFSLFGNNLIHDSLYNSSNNYVKNFGFSFYYGIKDQIMRYGYIAMGKLGFLREYPFGGIRVITEYSNVKAYYKWEIPYSGLLASNDTYLELFDGNWILNRTLIRYYFPVFKRSAFEIGGEILTDFGTESGLVYMGYDFNYLYAPVNGIASLGYSEISFGNMALKENITLRIPIFQIERGIGVFPVYFNNLFGGVNINLYEVLGANKSRPFSCSLNNFLNLDTDYIRFTMDFSINFNTMIFYDFPSILKIGYVYAPMRGGINRFYISFAQK